MKKIIIFSIFCTLSLSLTAKSGSEDKSAYLFSYFTDQNDGLKLAYSYDGLTWTALNDGKSFLKPEIGNDKLMRDPSILQAPDGTFHLVWTTGWTDRFIGYASSRDLIHWSEQQAIPVMMHEPTAHNCWAPELFYDEPSKTYYIIWATTIPGRYKEVATSESEKGLNHRIYYVTTKDFHSFSETKMFFNPDFSVIDASIVKIPNTQELLMVVKNENSNPPEKNLRVTRTKNITEGFPTDVSAPITGNYWAEGPSPLFIGDTLYIYFDKYRDHCYGAVRSLDYGKTWEDISDRVSFPKGTRHGTAFAVDISVVKKLIANNSLHIKITTPPKTRETANFNMGTAVNPSGKSISLNSQSLLFDGKPVIPVMGEIHYTRLPENEWRKELLKMKAGGVNIISTYVFWIHHEEVKGQFDWTGQRNLRHFIEICKELDLPVILRIGPWCHGEVRNGGFPDWLVKSDIKLRNNNPPYLSEVRRWYSEIFNQVRGLLWKDGGAIIGIQLENEYRGPWTYLAELKSIAREIGFDVPLYTRTGWPALTTPAAFGEIIPLYGDYPDGFWDDSLYDMPGDYKKAYLFRSFRSSTVIATEQLPKQFEEETPEELAYPFVTCELGGGMMPSYHRRINISPMDIYALALVKVGSGSNLPGYYMYHGGTNPDGKLTSLNEEQATLMTNYNDMPVKSYDFQAPLGEFGQINGQYHLLRRLHLFLHDFGSELALMQPFFPENMPDADNDSTLRWSVRSNGHSGFVFMNNYQRLTQKQSKSGVSFTLDLPDGRLSFPCKPFTVPANSSFFLPFNMKIGQGELLYSTTQPIAKILDNNKLTLVFVKNDSIPADFTFNAKNLTIDFSNVTFLKQDSIIYIENVQTGKSAAISLHDTGGLAIDIILLDTETSLQLWKGELAGKERLLISDSELTFDGNQLELTGQNNDFRFSIFPAPHSFSYDGKVIQGKPDGIFTQYSTETKQNSPVKVTLKQIKEAGALRTISLGAGKRAESPKDTDFDNAAVWQILLPDDLDLDRDIFLRFSYIGDAARIYAGDKLLTDNFYNGKPFEIGLKRYASEIKGKELTIKILPAQKDAPVYIQSDFQPNYGEQNSALSLSGVEVYEKQKAILETCQLSSLSNTNKWNAEWIGAISRKDAKLPEGNIYHHWGLAPELAALWKNIDTLATKSILLRKNFSLTDVPEQAMVYVCGLGHYELFINGLKVDESVFKPLWSDYNKTIYYNIFDISSMLRKGKNTISVMLGNGMYNVTGGRYYKFQGSFGPPTLLLSAEFTNNNGAQTKIVSDSSWRWSLSPVVFNSIYGGEDYDARLEQAGWNMPGFDDSQWQPVVVQESPKGNLVQQNADPVIIAEKFPVANFEKVDSCDYIYNFGQNHSGFPTIRVKGRRGQKIRLIPAEILDKTGQHVTQKGSGGPFWFEYTLKSDSVETWTPSFSYYGYQYIEVKDIDYVTGTGNDRPVLLDITSNFIHSAAKAIGNFECSNELFNKIHFIIDKAVRSNMQAVFTDCPHREKLGWLEETHLNGPGLLFNYDLRRFFPKVMRDIADSQLDNGLIPDIVPEYTVFTDGFRDSPEWGSAGVIIPWMYYEWYGDDSLIKDYYQVMKRYTDYLGTQAKDYILSYGLGDWYDYGQKPAGLSQNTPLGITATGHYYMCADYMARAAALLGKEKDQNEYATLAKNISAAFNQTFFNPDSCVYGNGSQCSYSIPLFLDIVPKEYKKKVLDNLLTAIEENGGKLTTGDIGNRYLFQALAMNGLDEVMYRMHNQMEVPGYGFQIGLGATTLTEQWDPRKGNSWNHFMMGQIEEWFWKSLAGIRPDIDHPGFSHFFIEPKPVGDLKWVKASFESIHGTIVSDWKIENGKFTIRVQVPDHTTASLRLPFGDKRIRHIAPGKHVFTVDVNLR